ncbi:phosphate/phosphite/phosphonate ABC transporter substrate-binding protein [Deferrisoma camini]|uniref:phosphate/phosphite/phosphonate ABC transporter substrate-binding protein n=1 Tax=Deferrisoma camini TaxID=1035120 RepID=UPI00046D6785|nr:phosphate/phosphite/phosphonate ABC transporter substrate-binding protein [Deferrisoma camini]
MKGDSRRPVVFLAAVGALAGLALLAVGGRSASQTFRIGYMICNSVEETRERFAPLTAYLSEATGARFEPVYLNTYDVEEAFARGEFEFTHTNSLLYITLRERYGVRPIAVERRGSFGAKTRGVIIARKDSGLRSLNDLRGKRLVFGPQWAPFGFLAQYALMLEAGVDPEKDLGYYAIPRGSWKHQKIIYSVLYGAFDAGTAPLIDLEEMAADGRIAPDDFVILGQSGLAPYCTFGASKEVPRRWADRVRKALLALDEQTTARVGDETLLVLKRAQIRGYDEARDVDYDELRRWARLAKMPPYEEY